MPDKHPNTDRWGGPGASHEDRTEAKPKEGDPRPPGTPTNIRHSQVSGTGPSHPLPHHPRTASAARKQHHP